MNFMAPGFQPSDRLIEQHGGDKVKAHTANFCIEVGKQGYMTPKDYEAGNFAKYGIDPVHVFDYQAEEKMAEKDAEIARLKKQLEKATANQKPIDPETDKKQGGAK